MVRMCNKSKSSNEINKINDANNSPEARVMRLKGYGNSLCAPVAINFIKAYMKSIELEPSNESYEDSENIENIE